jgi:hypothetical protein
VPDTRKDREERKAATRAEAVAQLGIAEDIDAYARCCAIRYRKPFRCSWCAFSSRGASAFRLGSSRSRRLRFREWCVGALSCVTLSLVCLERPPDADATLGTTLLHGG